LVITAKETKTTWRMPRDLHKDLKRYALENDTNVTAVVWRACREFLARDKMFKDRYQSYSGLTTISKENSVQPQVDDEILYETTDTFQSDMERGKPS
jgi:hypothetical protein